MENSKNHEKAILA